MSGINPILKKGGYFPLKHLMCLQDTLSFLKDFYETDIKEEHYEPAQVYEDVSGVLRLDFVNLETGELDFFLFNGSVAKETIAESVEDTPQLLMPVAEVQSALELEFCKEGVHYENICAWHCLLTEYTNGGWTRGTMGEYSLHGAAVLYVGPSADAPVDFTLPVSDCVVLLQLTEGKNKGLVCLCALPA